VVIALASAPAHAQFGQLDSLLNKAKTLQKVGEGFQKIGEQEEIKLGGDLAGMIMGAAPLIKDEAKQRYVNRLGLWLALHSERPNLPWKFGIIDSNDFNAFSMPGGYVLITRGLFDRMRSESELAGVLAHEVAHVVKKHHIAALQKSMRDQALGDMQAYFNPVSGSGIAGQFSAALLAAGKSLYTQGLSHDDEYEADRMGVVIAARSGYSPFGLVGVLQTLSGAPESKGYALHARTHPIPLDRISRLDAAMGTKLDAVPGVVEDLPTFVALRAPPPPPKPPAPAAAPKRKKRKP
jgi:Zn-dependent protease with chaperone function